MSQFKALAVFGYLHNSFKRCISMSAISLILINRIENIVRYSFWAMLRRLISSSSLKRLLLVVGVLGCLLLLILRSRILWCVMWAGTHLLIKVYLLLLLSHQLLLLVSVSLLLLILLLHCQLLLLLLVCFQLFFHFPLF